MKQLLLSSFLLSGLGMIAQDSCDDALSVTAGVYTVEEVNGEAPPYFCTTGADADNAEWYTYTAAEDALVTISSSLPENTGIDTRLQVYTGACASLACAGGDDDSGAGFLSNFTLVVYEGESITFAWDNRWTSSGFNFEVSEGDPGDIPLAFTPVGSPLGGGANGIVDMNGDFLDDLVRISNGVNIAYQENGELNPVSIGNPPAQYQPSWSFTAGDLDGNGYNDMMYGAGSGVSFMFANENGTDYSELTTNEYVFSQRGNMVDINNDGNLDAFMCHDVQPNVYYLSDGDGGLTFYQVLLAENELPVPHPDTLALGNTPNGGNYGSIWIDYDHDGDNDLFIAKCRGGSSPAKINQLHRNNGDGTFTNVGPELGLDHSIQTWSSAWGDYDNDGDIDLFIGASTFSDGPHMLLANDGAGNFIDVTAGSGIDNITSTGIENITHDFDNDGYLDILGLGGTFMKGNGDMTFTQTTVNITNGPVGDLNDDGFLDVSNGQIMYNNGNGNNYLKINMLGTSSNLNGIGATAHIYTQDLGVLTRQVRAGDGFRYMSSLNLHFGLGDLTEIDSLVITWPSGIQDVHTGVALNTTFNAVEGVSTVDVLEVSEVQFQIYPNPASDEIRIDGDINPNTTYSIFSVNGQLVSQGIYNNAPIGIESLETGAYVIQFILDGKQSKQTFIKQ